MKLRRGHGSSVGKVSRVKVPQRGADISAQIGLVAKHLKLPSIFDCSLSSFIETNSFLLCLRFPSLLESDRDRTRCCPTSLDRKFDLAEGSSVRFAEDESNTEARSLVASEIFLAVENFRRGTILRSCDAFQNGVLSTE